MRTKTPQRPDEVPWLLDTARVAAGLAVGAVLLGHMRIARRVAAWIATPDVLADLGPDE